MCSLLRVCLDSIVIRINMIAVEIHTTFVLGFAAVRLCQKIFPYVVFLQTPPSKHKIAFEKCQWHALGHCWSKNNRHSWRLVWTHFYGWSIPHLFCLFLHRSRIRETLESLTFSGCSYQRSLESAWRNIGPISMTSWESADCTLGKKMWVIHFWLKLWFNYYFLRLKRRLLLALIDVYYREERSEPLLSMDRMTDYDKTVRTSCK